VQPYTQFNFAGSRDFDIWPNAIWPSAKPLNLRFTVVNLLDSLSLLRSGDGIGEFAPQYGPHRGFFVTLSEVVTVAHSSGAGHGMNIGSGRSRLAVFMDICCAQSSIAQKYFT
jgi:hypothetical protein